GRALRALVRMRGAASVRVLGSRLEEVTGKARLPLIKALGRTRSAEAIEPLTSRFDDEDADVRSAAFDAAVEMCDKDIKLPKDDDDDNDPKVERRRRETLRDMSRAMRVFRAAVKAKDPLIRAQAADDLDVGEESGQNELLTGLFSDR